MAERIPSDGTEGISTFDNPHRNEEHMHIHVDASSPSDPELVEPDDFRAFDVVLRGSGDREAALAGLGSLADDGEHVFVDPARLRELAGDRATDPEWLAGLEKMTAFASGQGWIDGSGRIRAHVVAA